MLVPLFLKGQQTEKSTDFRDSFLGTYACTGLPWYPTAIHTWPILYVSVEKSLTDSTTLYFNDSTFGTINEEYRHPATGYTDSTYYANSSYFGDFKKEDTVHMINVVPGVGGYNIYCPKVCTTAVGTQFFKEKYQVFPNPFSNTLYLFTPWPQAASVQVNVYNTTGKCVYADSYKSETNGYIFYLSDLPAGVYVIEINDSENVIYKKIVKWN